MTIWAFTLVGVGASFAAGLCQGGTYRCTEIEGCSLDGVTQPCAYASSSAKSGGILFEGKILFVDWISPNTAKVSFGSSDADMTPATFSKDDKGTTLRIDGGPVIFIPAVEEQ